MTYREKLTLVHPENVDPKYDGGCRGCPTDYFPGAPMMCAGQDAGCTACWDQEMPSTEPNANIKPTEKAEPTKRPVVYIAGPITGVERYWEPFEKAEDDLTAAGFIPLSPAHLPAGMTNEQYARINFAQIDSADAVLFLPGSIDSDGARLEWTYCNYIGKTYAFDIDTLKEVLT